MNDKLKVVSAIVKFLKKELQGRELSAEGAEGVEVGIQCLETAYNISNSDPLLDFPIDLQEIVVKYLSENEPLKEPTAEEKLAAEGLKNEGNTHMSQQNFDEAVAYYTKAIKLDPKNAVYYCNRAAASNKLGNFESAIQDCKTALKFDPSYSKAYGRLGLAYASMNKHQEAVESYRKALELEPDNQSYRTNLKQTEETLASSRSTAIPFQNVDLGMIFSNPNLLDMASQMLANPSMQSMMSNILSGNMNQEGAGIDVLFQASHQLAQQMESENPALVEQLRQHIDRGNPNGHLDNPDPKPESDS